MQALHLQAGDDGEADRTATDDQRHVLLCQAGAFDRVPAHGHRFGQRGLVGRQPVRHFQQQPVGERHVLREAAGGLVGIADAEHGIA